MPDWKTNTSEAARLLRLAGRSATDERQAHRLLATFTSPRLTRDLAYGWRNLSEGDRDEVVIDTLCKFITAPPEVDTAYNWAVRTARNGANDRWRRLHAQRRQGDVDAVSLDAGADDDPDAEPLQEVAGPDNVERDVSLRECLAVKFEAMKSDAKGRTYVHVLLMVVEDLELDDIAERLGTSYTAAKARVHEARKAAARFFADCKD